MRSGASTPGPTNARAPTPDWLYPEKRPAAKPLERKPCPAAVALRPFLHEAVVPEDDPVEASTEDMAAKRSTLLTSPVSFADFVFRLAFFALAPFAIVIVAQLFPVRGALLDVGLALVVF